MSARERLTLYPPTEPYRHGRLKVGAGHEIYYEECGNPSGRPVAIVHGGPGGGCNATMRRYHDPARYRIVLFDQRGCGRSVPHASLEANTTWDLVADMELLRVHLGIDRWQLFGGSWGSTLALAYAEAHPERTRDIILRGVFLLRREELIWFYQAGCGWLFPEAFEEFRKVIPPEERGDMIAAYYRRLTHPDRDVQIAAARAWSIWEGSTLSLFQDPERVKLFGADTYAIAFARIECHYFVNKGFFEREDQLLADVHRIRHVPCTIVHGRYDVVTPAKNAWDLSRVWPEATLRIVPDAGHAMTEPGIVNELIGATRRHAALL
ncbi:MAG TPA: prolyl aminopeptidase [Hyphomicrobiaceae bacterium]|nr:prolyl aminopeptidase [Hyphomicrobiaceae bacterium]